MSRKGKYALNKNIAKNISSAISDFSMISAGDKILVGLSGGKDSNLLAYSLCRLRSRSPVKFEIEALSVDPTYDEVDFSALMNFTDSLGLKLNIFKYPIFNILKNSPNHSPCGLCANIRRGILASKAKELGCNTLALGHHRDDAIETVFLNLLYAGRFKCFHPNMNMSRTGIRVIRPLIYVSEKDVKRESESRGMPLVDFNCKYASTSQRMQVKFQIKELSKIAPDISNNIIHALKSYGYEDTWVSSSPYESHELDKLKEGEDDFD